MIKMIVYLHFFLNNQFWANINTTLLIESLRHIDEKVIMLAVAVASRFYVVWLTVQLHL